MLLTVEGVPALFHFPVSALTHPADPPQLVSHLLLPGNPLDLVHHEEMILVSLDNIHAPGSTTAVDEREVRLRMMERKLTRAGEDAVGGRAARRPGRGNRAVEGAFGRGECSGVRGVGRAGEGRGSLRGGEAAQARHGRARRRLDASWPWTRQRGMHNR